MQIVRTRDVEQIGDYLVQSNVKTLPNFFPILEVFDGLKNAQVKPARYARLYRILNFDSILMSEFWLYGWRFFIL
jgi:hypothetical protein